MEALEIDPEVVGGLGVVAAMAMPSVEVIDEVVVMPVELAELGEIIDRGVEGQVVASAAPADADAEDEDEEDDEEDDDDDEEDDEDEDDDDDDEDDSDEDDEE